MIRRATLDDLDECLRLGLEFHAYSPWSIYPVDQAELRAFMGGLTQRGVILLSDDGILGGFLNPLYFNPSILAGIELFWWARTGGADLRDAFEAWAIEQGAQGVAFSGLADSRAKAIERVFRRAGYTPVETSYYKRVA